MKHERHHWLEKLQVEFAAAAALAVTFFIVGPMHGWWDPQWPATFISTGSFGGLLQFALLVWALAAACAAITVSARPEGALLATFVGAVGVSMHSESIRVLFWANQESFGRVFMQLIAELAVLFFVAVVTIHIICRVRAIMARVCPGWMWKGRITEHTVSLEGQDAESVAAYKSKAASSKFLWTLSPMGSGLVGETLGPKGMPIVSPQNEAKSRKAALACMLYCLAATVLYSSILLMLLMRSPNRGQIVFALQASCLRLLSPTSSSPRGSALSRGPLPLSPACCSMRWLSRRVRLRVLTHGSRCNCSLGRCLWTG